MTDAYRTFWGEAHDNTYQFTKQMWPIEESLNRAKSHLDFYAAAYYTACADAFDAPGHVSTEREGAKIVIEDWKHPDRLEKEWAEVQAATKAFNRDGEFVTFPGYEWQGDGSSGDHNVFAREEGLPIFHVDTLGELYARLRGHDAIAIPHHTGYRPGVRGHDWSVHDETLTPFCEVFSIHGCSETDEEWIGLRNNTHMGPGQAGGTWQDGLDLGHHVGCMCSTDNWGEMPGCHGRGRMAVLAEALTRDALWAAFKARRVYGTTGDRIAIDFRLNDAHMGEAISCDGARRVRVRVEGSDEIDRIELLRDGQVIATHCHQGTWRMPSVGERCRWKLRVEAGWGPGEHEVKMPDRAWHGELALDGGRFTDWEPCWVSPGQMPATLDGPRATFGLCTPVSLWGHRPHNANVFTFDADLRTPLRLALNGKEVDAPVGEFAKGSRILWWREDAAAMLEKFANLPADSPAREDVYWHMGYKAKLHRALPEAAWTATLDFDDDTPLDGESHYRIRIEQRNGQRAWTSPIWVKTAHP